MTLRYLFPALLLGAIALVMPAAAQTKDKPKENCGEQNGQYAKVRLCVSSALAPQGTNSYGPQNILDTDGNAWCEGVTGYGIGETLTFNYAPAVKLQQFSFLNGYPKTAETYKNNSRVKQFRIQTSDGFATVVTVPDTQEEHIIKLPRAVKPTWVRFTIAEVYPGARGSDTCIAGLAANLEQLNN